MKQLLIKPVDTFFFRNQKDFISGVNNTAGNIFPPRPGTFYGALRSAFIHENSSFKSFYAGIDNEVKTWMGTPDKVGRFVLRGVMVYDGKDLYFPLPLDYQVIDEIHNGLHEEWAYSFELKEEQIPCSNGYKFRLYGVKDEKTASSSDAYVKYIDWKKAQLERIPIKIFRKSHWMIEEDKLGIKIDRRRGSSEEGMLYNIKMNRFLDSTAGGFIAFSPEGGSPDFQNIKMLQVGGKNRPWTLEQLNQSFELFDEKERQQLISKIKQDRIARLILLSPAIWRKDSNIYDHNQQQFNFGDGLRFDIISQASGRPILTGGWDIAHNRPKDRMLALPAGSVFYLKVDENKAESLFNTLYNQSISDELNHEGYGWAVCCSCPS